MELTPELAYLLGLITGRGKIYDLPSNPRITINFPFKDLTGIAFCPYCDNATAFVTKKKGTGKLTCRKCDKICNAPTYRIPDFHSQTDFIPEIEKTIFPIIKKLVKIMPEITKTKDDTRLSIDFSKENQLFMDIVEQFKPYTNYDSFEIPKIIHELDKPTKIEFVRGIADTAGFAAAGQWHTSGIMRGYFEFPNNWKLPVQLCNLLQDELDVPIQTMDWGLPNLRDPKMKKYKAGDETFGFKEHQLKLWADQFSKISFKLEFKQKFLRELSEFNIASNAKTDRECEPPKEIEDHRIKINHDAERSQKIPDEINGEHFDGYWQVCWRMGCQRCTEFEKSEEFDVLSYKTGLKKSDGNLSDRDQQIDEKRREKQEELEPEWEEIIKKRKEREKKKEEEGKKKPKNISKFLEKDTYEPQRIWLQRYLEQKYPNSKIDTYIGGDRALDTLVDKYKLPEELKDFQIMPDVIGIIDDEKLVFIESKIVALGLAEIGQLIAYCLIAKPEIAILCSTINSEAKLANFKQETIMDFGTKKIKCATWNQDKKEKNAVEISDMEFFT